LKRPTSRRPTLAGLKRRRIAVAVQLAFAIGAGSATMAPAHAQQISCPIDNVAVTLTADASNSITCDIINNGALNTGGFTLNNSSPGALNINSGALNNDGGFLTNYSGATLSNSGSLYSMGTLSNSGTLNNSNTGTLRNYGNLTNDAGGTLNNSGSLTNYGTLTNNGMLNNSNTGTLRNYDSLTNDAGGTLTNNGTLNNYSYSYLRNYGTLTNSGTLNNSGFLYNGSLYSYSGTTLNNSGTLNNDNDLRNYGTLSNSGTLNNSNTGTLRNYGNLTNDAGGTLNNSGSLTNYSGATLSNSGTLNNDNDLRNYGTLTNNGMLNNSNTGTLRNYDSLTNDAGGTLTNSGTLDNSGALTNSGQLTVTGTGILNGGGTITQNAGTLRVDGTLTQSGVTIAGGTLTGTGTINAAVTNSATLLPGAAGAPGTLTVVGSLVQNPSAVLMVNVTPTQASKVVITGPATLAGTVQVVPGTGTFAPTTSYTILSASGGVSGTFSSVSSSSAFLTPALDYDANNVFLELVRTAALASVASTPNQASLAALLDQIQTSGGGDADMQSVIGTLNGLSADETRAAFDSIAGAGLIAGFNGQFAMSDGFAGVIGSHLDAGGAGSAAGLLTTGSVRLAAANYLSDANPVYAQAAGRPAGGARADTRGVWVRVYGNEGKTSGDANASGYRQRGSGFAIGADAQINDRLRGGAAVNIGTQRVRGNAGSGDLNTDGVSVAVYAQYTDGPVTVKGIAGAGRNSNDGARTVSLGGETRMASSDFKSNQQFAYAEAAYLLTPGRVSIQPVAALSYTRIDNPAFTETGAGALNLMVQAQARESTRSYLGVRAIYNLDAGGAGIHLEPRVLWSHEFGNVSRAPASAQLAGAPVAGTFQTQGPSVKRDGAVLGLRASGQVRRNLALFGDVSAELRNGQSNMTLFVGARSTW
jgi:outer membrane autotransporter protein